jgi:hypothetical protein
LTDHDEPQRPTDRVREFQLREYEIADGHLDEFVDAWRRGVKPLRERFGFTVEAWLVRAESRFVWLLPRERCRGVGEPLAILGRQLQIGGRDIHLELLERPGARNRDDIRKADDPGEGDLGHRGPMRTGDVGERRSNGSDLANAG